MVNFKSYASSSKGNLYTVDDGTTRLMIECGLPFTKTKEALDFQVSSIDGVLISHCHADHSRAAKDLAKAGLDIYTSKGTIEALGLSGHRIHAIPAHQQFSLGTWQILSFDTIHDAPEPLSFLLANAMRERLLYVTDSCYLKYRFKNLSVIAIECNHSAAALKENVAAGIVPRAVRSRIIQSHFSIENVKQFLRVTDLSKLQEVHLLHLSDSNANAQQFKREIQALCGKEVYIAG